ncbi:phosphatase PAP2 family protein [Aggregatilinea lenta]|uniref:phosphatase PAP2 family protein n=1 Tax=Aggregatilinea lenta TaxID=913108 RepID=UPI000E5C2025|nr:phosphatase PAP2 family protein [Aggregatilinea lenta]
MNRKRLFLTVLVSALLLTLAAPISAASRGGYPVITQVAGAWPTFLIESANSMRLDAPPGDDAAEIEELQGYLDEVDDAMRAQIRYWNASVPAYRWNKLASEEYFDRAVPTAGATYGLALMNVAIYDATVAAFDSKDASMRERPSEADPMLVPEVPVPNSPSYPSEHAVAAGAASEVLAFLFPDKADYYRDMAAQSNDAMLHSGIYYPSDVEAGFALGQQVAAMAIAWADAHPMDLNTVDEINGGEGKWYGANPITPNAASWPTWVLSSPDEIMPPPPPEYGSEQLETEVQELRDIERTLRTTVFARYWEYGSGAFQGTLVFTEKTSALIWEYGLDADPVRGALVYTLLNIATYDATAAAFAVKYHYLGIRPFQVDPTFETVIPTPNHPSYPSAHSVITMAAVTTLAKLFPEDADSLIEISHQGGEARLWAGIHFRSDIVAGEDMGRQIADKVFAPFKDIF